jgi:hypothetical protein
VLKIDMIESLERLLGEIIEAFSIERIDCSSIVAVSDAPGIRTNRL